MARVKTKWTPELYARAVKGSDDVPGLRRVAVGFEAGDGFDLRNPKSWTPSQKKKVRTWYERVESLVAQEKVLSFPRSKAVLKREHARYHGDIPSSKFKAVFVPYTSPKGLPGEKRRSHRPVIKHTVDGDVIRTGGYTRYNYDFDPVELALNPVDEINRLLDAMPDAEYFYIRNGENQTLNVQVGRAQLGATILKYQHRYDGVNPLPRNSGNYGDSPEEHHWEQWLRGVVGFSVPRGVDVLKLNRQVNQGIEAAKMRRVINKGSLTELRHLLVRAKKQRMPIELIARIEARIDQLS